MALTNKGSKWENRNSLFLVWAFFPVLDCIPFFHMYSRVENKKYKKLGWASVIINIICIIAVIVTMVCTVQFIYFDSLGLRDYQDTQPELKDYLGYNYFEKYTYDEYSSMEEYAEYQKALDEWRNSSEVKEASRHADNVELTWTYIFVGIVLLYAIAIIVFLIKAFMERPKYLRELAKIYSASDVVKRISNIKPDINSKTKEKAKETDFENNNKDKIAVDINSASEDEIATLPGLTIIDAKKAVAYREEHGGFHSKDEFFSVFNAKPHIIARAEEFIVIGEVKQAETPSASGGKRRIDL